MLSLDFQSLICMEPFAALLFVVSVDRYRKFLDRRTARNSFYALSVWRGCWMPIAVGSPTEISVGLCVGCQVGLIR